MRECIQLPRSVNSTQLNLQQIYQKPQINTIFSEFFELVRICLTNSKNSPKPHIPITDSNSIRNENFPQKTFAETTVNLFLSKKKETKLLFLTQLTALLKLNT